MNSTPRVTFDTSIEYFARTLLETLGRDAVENGVIIRDGSGHLSFASNTPANGKREEIVAKLKSAVQSYARPDRILSFQNEYGVDRILADPSFVPLSLGDLTVRLLDRRIVGSAWLESPASVKQLDAAARLVFASLKGGVGRSTALAVAAADLARRNRNTLVIDLDFEAPGLGDFLLGDDRIPDFGTVDFLVENAITPLVDNELDCFVGVSGLTAPGGGRVDVVPSFGKTAGKHPENVLAKLSRAMIEEVASDREALSVTGRISQLIDRLTERGHYDAILIDSRAGLSELMAPAILGLGATVLLFGTAQKQTIEGYRALFAGLKLLAERDRMRGDDASWRSLFKPVHAKASLDPDSTARYRDELYYLFSEFLYDAEEAPALQPEAFTFDIDDPTAPHSPLIIPFNPSFAEFDSARHTNQLTQAFYEQTFRQFMDGLDEIIAGAADLAA